MSDNKEDKKEALISRMGDYAVKEYQDVIDRMTRVEVTSGNLEIYVKMTEEDREIFSNDVEIQDGYIKMTFNLKMAPKCTECPYKEIADL